MVTALTPAGQIKNLGKDRHDGDILRLSCGKDGKVQKAFAGHRGGLESD